jgi:hypothetical protein
VGAVAAAGAAASGCFSANAAANAGGDPNKRPDDGGAPGFGAEGPGSLAFIHASPDLFDFRVCFEKLDTRGSYFDGLPEPSDYDAPMPLSNFPGVPLGGAVRVPLREELLAGARPVLIHARRLETAERRGQSCQELFCNTTDPRCLERNIDYRTLADIRPGTLEQGVDHLLVVTGCLPIDANPSATAEACGTNYTTDRGNLGLSVFPLESLAVRPGVLEFFLLNAAPKLNAADVEVTFESAGGPAADGGDAGGGDAGADGGTTRKLLATGPAYLQLTSTGVQVSALASDALPTFDQSGVAVRFSPLAAADGGPDDSGVDGSLGDGGESGDGAAAPPQGRRFFSLADIQRVSDPLALPNSFFAPGPFVLALVGDPDLQPPSPSDDASVTSPPRVRWLHVLAVPFWEQMRRDAGPTP